jgi:transposase
MGSDLFIGVDIAQRTFDVAEADQVRASKLLYTPRVVRQWLQSLPEHCHIAVESTGDLHRPLVRAAIAAGHTVYVLNARDLAHYARSLGRRAKTDRLDAKLIARYLAHEYRHLHPYRLPTALQEQLDQLIARRHKVVVTQQSLRQSFRGMSCKPTALAPALKSLQVLLRQIDARIEHLVGEDPLLSKRVERLQSIVGFGALVGSAIAHALTRHPFASDDAFVAYIGYDPRPRDSGQKRCRRFLSKRGPAELRRLLFTAAMSASRSKLWKPFYQRYRDRGLSSTEALVILARKLARIAFSMLKHNTYFDPTMIKIT